MGSVSPDTQLMTAVETSVVIVKDGLVSALQYIRDAIKMLRKKNAEDADITKGR